jgi:thymidylate synthase
MNPEYKATGIRVPNYNYRDCLQNILREGKYTKNPNQKMGRYTLLTLPPMVFKLSNGFPIITERDISAFWQTPIAELLAFINGVHTVDELKKWGCGWWARWGTAEKCAYFGLEPGDLGPGSYGCGFNYKLPDGSTFNQFDNLVKEIKWSPYLSTHKVSAWIPHFCLQHENLQRKVTVAPCHGDVQVTILGDELTLNMTQRSGDYPIGVPTNMIQYAALTIMIAHVTGFKPYEYVHRVIDAQIYEDQVACVEELTQRKTNSFPTVHLTEEGLKITSLFDFRPHHFELRDYRPFPAMKIPTTE